MKNILSITAGLTFCSIAISYKENLFELNSEVNSTSHLPWLVQKILEENKIEPNEIEGIITSAGPGSFTGMRAAQSFVKGFAFALKIPAVSVSYFDVIENEAKKRFGCKNFPKLIVIKSEKKQVYYCMRESEKKSSFGVSACDISELIKNMKNDFCIIGDAIEEISPYVNNDIPKYVMNDFKNAKYFSDFAYKLEEPNPKIDTIYINASTNASLKIPEK